MQVAILGCGVVGCGTADLITKNGERLASLAGEAVEIKYILERRVMPDSPYAGLFVKDFDVILADPDVSVVIEAMGGSHPAFDFSLAALKAGKHVITSNKEVVANFGNELLLAAKEAGVQYLFEASVGGGIPVIRPLASDLAGNRIDKIAGILNGTTNYILTRMFTAGIDFAEALREAKEKGYAEANPAADVEGTDACRKIAILAAVTGGVLVPTDKIHTEGITGIRAVDVAAAAKHGYQIKLLGRMEKTEQGEMFLMVAPFLVPEESPLARISDVFNGVLVHGDFVDNVLFYGRGAGAAPTASSMVGDLVHLLMGGAPTHGVFCRSDEGLTDFSYFVSRHYLALSGVDKNAVAVIFGDADFWGEGEELHLLTAELSESEFSDKLNRLLSCGAEQLSHIRLL